MWKKTAVVLAFFACGKHVIVTRPTTQAPNTVAISGRVYLIAPIVGANIRVTALSRVPPAVVADNVSTQPDGSFSVTVTAVDGDFLVEATGGNSIEPVTGIQPIPLSQDDKLSGITLGTSLGGSANVQINPWSTLVSVRSQTEAAISGTAIADAYKKNVALFSAHFGTASPWEASPVDLVAGAAPGLTSSTIYSLAVIAMSDEALALGARAGTTDISVVNTLTVLRLLVADQTKDTLFDGKSEDQTLPPVAGRVHIDAETTRASLADALQDFLGSAKNQSGLSSRDVESLLNAIRFDTSELYPGGSSDPNRDPTSESGAGPAISINVPTENQTLGTADHITATLHDADGITSAVFSLDGATVNVAFVQESAKDWGLSYLPALPDGAHLLELDAVDALGNMSTATVHFSIDQSAPTIAFVSCDAPDDRLRTVTTSAAGVVYASDTTRMACSEADLMSGAQSFFTFADLALQPGAVVPSIQISVTDASTVASTTCEVLLDGVSQGAPLPCPAEAAPATNLVSLSSALFGSNIVNIADTSAVIVRITATDSLGNYGTRDFSFALNILPAPLFITQLPTSGVALENSHFEDGTIDAVFSASSTWINLAQYSVENVSSRSVKLPVDSLGLLGGYAADAYHAFFTHYDVYEDTQSDDSVTVGCAPGSLELFVTNGATTCAPTVASTFTRGTLKTTIVPRVVNVASGTPLASDDNGEVTLEPLTAYNIFLSTTPAVLGHGFFGQNPAVNNIWSGLPSTPDSRACGIEPIGEGYHGYYVGPTQTENGFTAKTTLWQDANSGGTQHQFYGYMSCDGWRVGNNSAADPPRGLAASDLPLTGTFYTRRYAAAFNLPDGYVLGDLWLERRVKFTSSSTWTPTIHLTTSGAMLAAKPDRSNLSFVASLSIEAPKPDLSALQDPSFDRTLPGW